MFQKQESFLKPLVDQYAKEGKDKKVMFEAVFSKPNSKPKWFFKKDVGISVIWHYLTDENTVHTFTVCDVSGTLSKLKIQDEN